MLQRKALLHVIMLLLYAQATFRVRAMDRFLNLVKLPPADLDAAGPKGFQALLLGPNRTEQVP